MNNSFKAPTPSQARKLFVIWFLALFGGMIGTISGRIFRGAIQTNPAWLGPAILIGSIALLLIALLLSPTAIRHMRAEHQPPAA